MPARQCTLRYRLLPPSKWLIPNAFSRPVPGSRRHVPLHSVTPRDGQKPIVSMKNGYVTTTEPPSGGAVFTRLTSLSTHSTMGFGKVVG